MEPAKVDAGAKADEVVLVENVLAGLFWFEHSGGQRLCYGPGDLGCVLVVDRITENDGAESWGWHGAGTLGECLQRCSQLRKSQGIIRPAGNENFLGLDAAAL